MKPEPLKGKVGCFKLTNIRMRIPHAKDVEFFIDNPKDMVVKIEDIRSAVEWLKKELRKDAERVSEKCDNLSPAGELRR